MYLIYGGEGRLTSNANLQRTVIFINSRAIYKKSILILEVYEIIQHFGPKYAYTKLYWNRMLLLGHIEFHFNEISRRRPYNKHLMHKHKYNFYYFLHLISTWKINTLKHTQYTQQHKSTFNYSKRL